MKQTKAATYSWLVVLLSVGSAGCSGGMAAVGEEPDGGATGGTGGSASVPDPPERSGLVALTIEFGTDVYDYSCDHGGSALSSDYWEGPATDLRSYPDSVCEWPQENPAFYLSVLFTGFLRSEGFPKGSYDLAQPIPQNVMVTLNAESQATFPVGQPNPYARYSSAPADAGEIRSPTLPAAGASGTVTVVKYEPEADPESLIPSYDVALTNVVLPMFDNMGSDYPGSVTIRSARFLFDYF